MSYEYADRDRDKLTVVGVAGAAYVHARHGSQEISVRVEAEDAPAVALAILEAAGCDKAGRTRLSRAMIALIEHISAEKVRAGREAEDAKVVEFHGAIGANLDRVERHHRDLYNAARKFFEDEA